MKRKRQIHLVAVTTLFFCFFLCMYVCMCVCVYIFLLVSISMFESNKARYMARQLRMVGEG